MPKPGVIIVALVVAAIIFGWSVAQVLTNNRLAKRQDCAREQTEEFVYRPILLVLGGLVASGEDDQKTVDEVRAEVAEVLEELDRRGGLKEIISEECPAV